LLDIMDCDTKVSAIENLRNKIQTSLSKVGSNDSVRYSTLLGFLLDNYKLSYHHIMLSKCRGWLTTHNEYELRDIWIEKLIEYNTK